MKQRKNTNWYFIVKYIIVIFTIFKSINIFDSQLVIISILCRQFITKIK